jgi:hypothetical protein
MIFVVFNAGPILLRAIEYQRVEVKSEETTPAPASVPPPTPSYTVDEAGHRHWVVTISDFATTPHNVSCRSTTIWNVKLILDDT